MNEKKYKIIIVVSVIITLILLLFIVKNNRITAEEKQLIVEYEKLNGKVNNSSKKEYLNVTIPSKNRVKYISSKKAINILTDGTGIIYFGFPECPWCRNMITPLIETIISEDVESFYYYNAYPIRDEKRLENDEVVTKIEGTEDYYKILELLGEKADVYEGLNDESIKRLYFPTVVFVKDGKVVYTHTSTVEGQNDPYKKLSKKQIDELKKIYKKGIALIKNTSTGEICTGRESC